MLFLNNFKFILPEIFLSSLILFLIIIGVFFNKIQYKKKYFSGLKNIIILNIAGLIILFFLNFWQYNCDFFILNFHYIGDRCTHFIKSLLILFTIFLFIFADHFSVHEKEFYFEYFILILLALLGLLLMVNANDFIFLYLALELQSLSLYVLATSNRYYNKSIEGGLKYFIFGSLASGLSLFGISLLYGFTGLTNLSELSIFFSDFHVKQDWLYFFKYTDLVVHRFINRINNYKIFASLYINDEMPIMSGNVRHLVFCWPEWVYFNYNPFSFFEKGTLGKTFDLYLSTAVYNPLGFNGFRPTMFLNGYIYEVYPNYVNLNNFNNVWFLESYNLWYLLSFFFIISGFLFKFSIVPLHSWTPDVYEGSPLFITAFFATVPKITIFFIFFKIIFTFLIPWESFYFTFLKTMSPKRAETLFVMPIWNRPVYWNIKSFFLITGLASVLIGSLGALYQQKITRLLAYSTISNMGFIFLCLLSYSFIGFHCALIYLILYLLLNLSFFGFLLSLRNLNGKLCLNIKDFSTIFRINPIIAILLTFNLFSIAGIPPLAGFFSKFYLIYNLILEHEFNLSVISVLVGVYSCIYYIRLIKIMFFEKPFFWGFFHNISNQINYFLIFLFFINIFFFGISDLLLICTRNICLRLLLMY